MLSFHTTTPACYFLDRDNLCSIEKRHGRGLKPGVCTLFPFNVFTRIGSAVAISPTSCARSGSGRRRLQERWRAPTRGSRRPLPPTFSAADRSVLVKYPGSRVAHASHASG